MYAISRTSRLLPSSVRSHPTAIQPLASILTSFTTICRRQQHSTAPTTNHIPTPDAAPPIVASPHPPPTRKSTATIVRLDEATADALQSKQLKHRQHPGVERVAGGSVTIDAGTVKAIGRALGEHPAKQVWTDSLALTRYLRARHAPAEAGDVEHRRRQLELEVRQQLDDERRQQQLRGGGGGGGGGSTADASDAVAGDVDNDDGTFRQRVDRRVRKLLQQRTYSWKPIEYDAYRSLQYLLGRAPAEYAVLVRIFGELARRQPDWKPRSFFDFGSGCGTGSWAAADRWADSLFEYFCVDASRDMNDLAELLLRGGDDQRPPRLRNVNYRQFLPATADPKYELVLSAYSLLELPDAKSRLQTVRTLWNKCDRFLVLVEQGTRAGFGAVNEARDYLLYSMPDECRVFAPCPHSLGCPRHADAADRTPCNFLAPYTQLPFGIGASAQATAADVRYEPFSYVVLEKCGADADASVGDGDDRSWPRIVRPTLVRARHTICRLCTSSGRLEEVIFTKSQHGADAYRCARTSRWGDRLPVRLEQRVPTEMAAATETGTDTKSTSTRRKTAEDEDEARVDR